MNAVNNDKNRFYEEIFDDIIQEKDYEANPLSQYSIRQLKEEIKRRENKGMF